MDPWVHWEWCKWPSEWLVFTSDTSNVLLDCEMYFAAIRLRECPNVEHTKAESVEVEGVYPTRGNWRYHKIQCYMAYNPIYLFPTSSGASSTGCNLGPLNLLIYVLFPLAWVLHVAIRAHWTCWLHNCHLDCIVMRYRLLPKSTSDHKIACVRHWWVVYWFKVREEILQHVCILDPIICEWIGK